MLGRIELGLWLLGLTALGYYGLSRLEAALYQSYQGQRLESRAGEPVRDGAPLGRLEIPRVGLSVIVLEGSDTRSLRLGVGHIRGTALPGEPGNVVLAGHRDTFFRPLAGVRANDEIILTAGQQKSRYRVESLQVVDREQTEALRSTPEPAVTLIICYPFSYVGSAPQRLIVRALERKE